MEKAKAGVKKLYKKRIELYITIVTIISVFLSKYHILGTMVYSLNVTVSQNFMPQYP